MGRCGNRQIRQGIFFRRPHSHPMEGAFILSFCEIKHTKGFSKNMKKTINSVISVALSILLILCLASCGNTVNAEGLWENATYLKDTEFGEGAKTVQVEVKVEEQSVTFTVNTDKDILGDALLEHGIIAGEEGAYGLYIKVVNGITADYDVDQSYWAFYQNGEYMMTGVDSTEISGGEHYELVYTK